jgi:RimJ/RimL family protein N-acetyltransferase
MPAETAELRDGSDVVMRQIEPDDIGKLREIWAGLSADSRRRRFLASSSVADISDAELQYLVDVDHRRHEAILALGPDGRALGVARYVRTPGDRESAEVAVVVVDDWHNRGLGTALLDRLTDSARENGIKRYTAIVSEDNDVVLQALERAGAERTNNGEDGEIEFVFDVPAEGIGDRLAAALRAAASAPVEFLGQWVLRFAVWRRWH